MVKAIFFANLANKTVVYRLINQFKFNLNFAHKSILKFGFMFALFLVGCEQPDVSNNGIEEVNWQLTKIKTNSSQTVVPEAVVINLKLAKGNISGNGGCNNYTSTYKIEGKNLLKISTIGSTKKYCENSSSLESKYFSYLEKSQTYKIQNDGTLEINCGDLGNLVFKKYK